MSVLVTGSNGFLGAILVERLLEAGEKDLVCMVRGGSNRARLDAVKRRHPDKPFEVVVGSLATPDDAARMLRGVHQVHHLAAALSGAAADMFLNTVVASKNLLEAAAKCERKPEMVLVSSFSVYGVADLEPGHLLTEETPLEAHPERRDLYAQAKLRQEQLFWEYREKHGIPLTVLRPGVIYGPGGGALSTRVGLRLPGVFVHLGRDNLLPLSYVDNCAEASVVVSKYEGREGQAYNVLDDELLTCREYLRRYRKEVEPLRSVSLPYFATQALSRSVEAYHRYSKGQLPAILTPYKAASAWGGNRFSNDKLKSTGWKPLVSTEEGIQRAFAYLREKQAAG